ncbi:cob(I)yrinic acid a,c-diamide adenosyltransferase [Pelosinus propionicus]|uniref:Corrinoid adenosyltransferase n=1 Tax=Pelosinus propionicus DSM 13327 TaxID=1123291 RepID=A0A1I4L9Q5_9FIRM|nr:cob(I)yrinic acid a,c-diamide adenosyltransferase [Pelosinus propionicus]SFL87596.1 cob(I)alamin adenosyltransferase [Pelosinus propionicus DSM 13327]
MKVYTKTGDKGTTGLLTGERIDKDSLRVEAYGIVDEINSALGLARVWCCKNENKDIIYSVQKMLMMVMADLASVNKESYYITEAHVKQLEQYIDALDAKLAPLKEFIIPGGNAGAAALDLARTTARRGERQTIKLSKQEDVNEQVLIALNRLSDLCFMLSRAELEQNQ